MAKKAQILVNGHNVRQSTALSGLGKAMDSHNAVKQGFHTGKCVISTQNQADFIYLIMQNKPNFRMAQINANIFSTRIYGNFFRLRAKGKQTQTKPIKANLKIPSFPKEREEKKGAGREGENRLEHLLINRTKLKIPLTQSRSICYKQNKGKSLDFPSYVGGNFNSFFIF